MIKPQKSGQSWARSTAMPSWRWRSHVTQNGEILHRPLSRLSPGFWATMACQPSWPCWVLLTTAATNCQMALKREKMTRLLKTKKE